MRGLVSGIEEWRQEKRMRLGVWISCHASGTPAPKRGCGAGPARSSSGLACESFLFYLTRAFIFDNRHGLLKKFDSVPAAETLSAVKPQN
jgi:hypothetical protein